MKTRGEPNPIWQTQTHVWLLWYAPSHHWSMSLSPWSPPPIQQMSHLLLKLLLFNPFLPYHSIRPSSLTSSSGMRRVMPLVLLLLLHTLVFPLLAFPPLPSLGPWFLDSSVTDHITSNKSLFFYSFYFWSFTFYYFGQWFSNIVWGIWYSLSPLAMPFMSLDPIQFIIYQSLNSFPQLHCLIY